MAASKEKVNLYKINFIYLMENAGWVLVEDCGYVQSPGDGLWWVTHLIFKNGDKERIVHHTGTTRDALNFFVGLYKALTYVVE